MWTTTADPTAATTTCWKVSPASACPSARMSSAAGSLPRARNPSPLPLLQRHESIDRHAGELFSEAAAAGPADDDAVDGDRGSQPEVQPAVPLGQIRRRAARVTDEPCPAGPQGDERPDGVAVWRRPREGDRDPVRP